MTDTNINRLATIAAETCMKAAAEYIICNNLKVVDYDAATACLQTWCKSKLDEALADAKQALDANMGQIAEITFKATMAKAGIEAAKEFAIPAN